MLLADADRARALGLPARARIVAQCLIGAEPHFHLDGPIAATERVLAASGTAFSCAWYYLSTLTNSARDPPAACGCAASCRCSAA